MNRFVSEWNAIVPDIIVPILTFFVTTIFAVLSYINSKKVKDLQTFSIKIRCDRIKYREEVFGKVKEYYNYKVTITNVSNVPWYINEAYLLLNWKEISPESWRNASLFKNLPHELKWQDSISTLINEDWIKSNYNEELKSDILKVIIKDSANKDYSYKFKKSEYHFLYC